MRKLITTVAFFVLLFSFFSANAQVKTNLSNPDKISNKGKFNKSYKTDIDFEVPKKNIKELLENEEADYASTNEDRPFRLAIAIPVDIDITKQANWSFENKFAYGKFSIRLNGALSSSINFDKFNLPSNTEMYIYNESGNMITGPITEKENNPNNVWGSWVYQGEYLNIEIKTPTSTYKDLILHSNNIAYGYKHIYQIETAGFGTSESCNINVICPLGTGWETERNSVALVLNDNGQDWCSGAMVMNTCNTNRPFFLTANHCFTGQNVNAWRFMFQAWSPTCPHPGVNNDGVTYNGSTLRANWAGTDFCLVELSNTPPANSGINYAGWNRNTADIIQTTIIHHPQGDVMKISRDNQAPVFDNFLGAQCWRLGLDQGATQGGSSGAPYFDQNHRIIGQHYGIDDGNLPVCNRSRKFGGRFDLSWTGGGTNATRLSNWLDPSNSGAMTTNTTNVSLLTPTTFSISGSEQFCNTSTTYSIPGLPLGATVTWSTLPYLFGNYPSGSAIINTPNSPTTTLTKTADGVFILRATISNVCGSGTIQIQKQIVAGPPLISIIGPYDPIQHTIMGVACAGEEYYFISNDSETGQTYTWTLFPPPGSGEFPRLFSGSQVQFDFVVTGYHTLRVSKTNSCGTTYTDMNINVQECFYFRLSTSPNPATNQINVVIDDETYQVKALSTDTDVKFELFNFNTGLQQRQWAFKNVQNRFNLNLSGVNAGVYILRATKGKYKQAIKVIVN
jgi:lysyl endopeptidase